MKTSDLKKALDQRVSSTEWTADNTWNVLNQVRKEKAAPKHPRIPAVLCAAAALLILFAGILAGTGRLGLSGRPDQLQDTTELIPLAQRKITPETELYYIPEIGEYYHLEPNCPAVSIQHKPMQAHFTWAEVNNEAYRGLQPCSACGAPLRPALPAETAEPAVTETPATEEPVTEVPVTEAPATEAPAAVLPANSAASQSVYTYEKKSDGTIRITGADKNIRKADIPAELDGYTVTGIGPGAFEECRSLTEVILPDTVKEIGSFAFAYSDLKSINLPDSVTVVDNDAFRDTYSLSSIRISDDHPHFALRNNALIRKKDMTLLKYTGQGKGPCEIEPGIKTIAADAFSSSKVTRIIIPDSVTLIEEHAFSYTDYLKELTLPDSVTSIGEQAFFMSGITSLNIPAGLATIGEGCFTWCEGLKNIDVDPANPVYEMRDNLLVRKTDNSLLYCLDNGAETMEIPEGIDIILDQAFTGNKHLKEIIIPDSVKEIAEGPFFQCEALESIRLPEGLDQLGYLMFAHCQKLKSITVPASVRAIADNAFLDCIGLSEVIILSGNTRINSDAFAECGEALTVRAPAGSLAQKFCEQHGILFEELD